MPPSPRNRKQPSDLYNMRGRRLGMGGRFNMKRRRDKTNIFSSQVIFSYSHNTPDVCSVEQCLVRKGPEYCAMMFHSTKRLKNVPSMLISSQEVHDVAGYLVRSFLFLFWRVLTLYPQGGLLKCATKLTLT